MSSPGAERCPLGCLPSFDQRDGSHRHASTDGTWCRSPDRCWKKHVSPSRASRRSPRTAVDDVSSSRSPRRKAFGRCGMHPRSSLELRVALRRGCRGSGNTQCAGIGLEVGLDPRQGDAAALSPSARVHPKKLSRNSCLSASESLRVTQESIWTTADNSVSDVTWTDSDRSCLASRSDGMGDSSLALAATQQRGLGA